jgi:hypothetical protein
VPGFLTQLSALGMIGFVVVQSFTDVIGPWQRALWELETIGSLTPNFD